ncbi:hypothetical protein DFJ73DRAFT_813179 [Zopfochytrium polystomum]|nr:hypothetical protein DFJ73DRAFT_813179 [Zopfochytrium polystomum]
MVRIVLNKNNKQKKTEMWRTSVAGLSVLLLQLIAAGHAAAHAILTSPVAWKGMADGTGIKYRGQAIPGSPEIPDSISCEGFTDPGTISMTSIPGSALTVAWDVTIDHANPPGVSVKLQMGGDGTANGGAWIDLATGVDVHSLSTTVTLPSMVTGNGVLRWSWQSQSDGGYYVSCSTISLKAVAAGWNISSKLNDRR